MKYKNGHANITGATLIDLKRFSRFAELDAMARLLGVSRAQCVEQIVNEYLSHHPVPRELWQ